VARMVERPWYPSRQRLSPSVMVSGSPERPPPERLQAYAPELDPDEGVWQQLTGLELRNLCCFNPPHLRRELRDAVKRLRRKARLIKSFFRGATL
jgi:hypothetical protein